MSRCPYCGKLFIGNRDGIGTHLSSLVYGVIAGLSAAVLLVRAFVR